jgi:hypothetical protein
MSSAKKVKKLAAEAPRKRHVAIGRKPTKAIKPKRRPAATASSKTVRRPASKSARKLKPRLKIRRRPTASKTATLLVVPPALPADEPSVDDIPSVPARPLGMLKTQTALAKAEHDCLLKLGHTCVTVIQRSPPAVSWCHREPCEGATWAWAPPVVRPPSMGFYGMHAEPRSCPTPVPRFRVPAPTSGRAYAAAEAAADELARCKIIGGFTPWATIDDDGLRQCLRERGHLCVGLWSGDTSNWCKRWPCAARTP